MFVCLFAVAMKLSDVTGYGLQIAPIGFESNWA